MKTGKMNGISFVLLIVVMIAVYTTSQPTTAGNRGSVDLQSRYIKDGKCAYTFILPDDQSSAPCNGEYDQALQRIEERMEKLEAGQSSYPGLNTTSYPIDCHHAYLLNGSQLKEGLHIIHPEGYPEPFPVYCEVTDDGAWTVIQRRKNGSISFKNDWLPYKYGFGPITGEHWLGNEKLYHLLRTNEYKLHIELHDWYGNSSYAEYDHFRIGDEESKYTLWLGIYSGTAGDSMRDHVSHKFSTKDDDNDGISGCCACTTGSYSYGHGGWWYFDDGNCHTANLNGEYMGDTSSYYYGVIWKGWQDRQGMKTTIMKVKRLRN